MNQLQFVLVVSTVTSTIGPLDCQKQFAQWHFSLKATAACVVAMGDPAGDKPPTRDSSQLFSVKLLVAKKMDLPSGCLLFAFFRLLFAGLSTPP